MVLPVEKRLVKRAVVGVTSIIFDRARWNNHFVGRVGRKCLIWPEVDHIELVAVLTAQRGAAKWAYNKARAIHRANIDSISKA
jgi:hypothetical protein